MKNNTTANFYVGTNHYSFAQETLQLISHANDAAEMIMKDFPENGDKIPVLCYSGMSGIAHATAISIALQMRNVPFGMVYVRKRNERTNSEHSVEVNIPLLNGKTGIMVFVDDFISSAKTMVYVFLKIIKSNRAAYLKTTYSNDFYVLLARSIQGDPILGKFPRLPDFIRNERYKKALKIIQKR